MEAIGERGERTGDGRRVQGFALMELTVAIALMAIAFAGITTTLATTTSLRRQNHDTARAMRAALNMSESLKDVRFYDVFALFNLDPNDDPDGPSTGPGPNFAVPGLQPTSDDPDGFVGRISFPGDGLTLREDVVQRQLGLPRDLNNDGKIDSLSHSDDYELLPVIVRVEWQGSNGKQSIEIVSDLSLN